MGQLNKKEKGQTLFELVVALGIGILMLTAVVVLVTGSVKNSTFSQNKALATRYAQEALEWVKGEKEQSWDTFYTRGSSGNGITYCLQTLSWGNGSSGCPVISGSTLTRTLVVKQLDLDNDGDRETLQVTAKVTWPETGELRSISLDSQFSDWRAQ